MANAVQTNVTECKICLNESANPKRLTLIVKTKNIYQKPERNTGDKIFKLFSAT